MQTVPTDINLGGLAQVYGDPFERIRAIKREWDPANIFPGAFNIPPAER